MTPSQRTNPLAVHGMVTSPNHLASQAGLEVLRRGGTAVDAVIACAAALAVVYPQMCTIGGDGFWLIYNAKTGKLRGLNASGRAGSLATIEHYRSLGLGEIPARGPLAANTVPGIVSGWDEAWRYSQEEMGSAYPWERLFESAILYAKDGFPVNTALARWLVTDTDERDTTNRSLQQRTEFAAVFMKDGRPYALGEILKQEDLAAALMRIAKSGAREFYEGSIAQKIVLELEKLGGLLTLEDFRKHTADWVEPIRVPYRDLTACNLPPNTQGMASLEILNILNNYNVGKYRDRPADYCHLLVEATKLAFADRDRYLSDPAFTDIPLDKLLSREYGRAQAAHISKQKAAPDIAPMDPNGDTVWLGVVDSEGNAVSYIQSIYHDFGSGVIPAGTGVILQNRGTHFSLDPEHVNALAPGKRTFHTLNPPMLLKDGKPYLVYGTMGGEGQPQTQTAIVTRIVDFGMTPQQAIDAPRWRYGRSWGKVNNQLILESRMGTHEVLKKLRNRGHENAKRGESYSDIMGHAGAILINQETGVLQGASDPRGDGLACGW